MDTHLKDKPTGEWTTGEGDQESHIFDAEGKCIGYADSGPDAVLIADAKNAALAAVNRVAQAWEDDARLYAKNSDRYRENVQTLVDALIKIANDPHCDRCQVAVNALAKVNK